MEAKENTTQARNAKDKPQQIIKKYHLAINKQGKQRGPEAGELVKEIHVLRHIEGKVTCF